MPGPTTNVAVTSGAGAVSIILMWVASLFHLDIPMPVAAAVTVVISSVSGYLIPHPVDTGMRDN
jgi:hypothetical protein